MIYLKKVKLLSDSDEGYIIENKKNIFNTLYPLKIFPTKELQEINFEPITIFYGGNGSGKTTLLNIIADGIKANKKNKNNFGELYNDYINIFNKNIEIFNTNDCQEYKFISSDDIFDYLLDIRAINSKVNRRKEELSDEYLNYKFQDNSDININDYEMIKNKHDSNRNTISKYVRERLRNNTIIQESNGETALNFWQNEITQNSIYIIDEPENSLSAQNQLKLKNYIEESARFYNCQFIIATHSPFLLSINGAKIYDLDESPCEVKKWTDLKNVKEYYNFFMEHKDEFN